MDVRILLGVACVSLAIGQAEALPKSVRGRIQRVENNLIPYNPIYGFKGWTLLDRMKHYQVPGATIAVIHKYKIDWIKSYGMADVNKEAPVDNDTVFSCGSISKFANAMLVMKLVQDGKLTLDKPINDQIKDYKLPLNEFTRQTQPTLRMLLTHQGGTSQSAFYGYQPGQALPTTLQTLKGEPPAENRPVITNSSPGKDFRYSGGGVLLTQLAATEATGKEYPELMEELLLRPLGIRSTTMRQPLPIDFDKRAAYAYSSAPWFTGVPYVYPQLAAAGMYSNAEGIATMLIEVQNALRNHKAKVLTQASALEMVKPSAKVSEGTYLEDTSVGTFLLQLKSNNQKKTGLFFGHSGRNAGFLADALASVVGGEGVVILTNRDGQTLGFLQEIRRSVAKTYHWTDFLPPAVTPVDVGTENLDRLTGRYKKGDDEITTFRREGAMLMQSINGYPEIICVPQTRNKCLLTDFGIMAEFQLDQNGVAESYLVTGISKEMPRLHSDQFLPNELLRDGRISEAIAEYRKKRLDVWALTSMAGDYIERGLLDCAAALLKLGEELYPAASIVARNQGIVAERSGKTSEAIACYKKAVELDKTDEFAVRRISKLLKQ